MSFGRLERSASAAPMSDINMTPLIDVMLVILVIFMITAPLMTSSLKLSPAGELYFGEEKLERAAFELRLAAAAKGNPELEVQLRADQNVPYGRVAELIGLLQKDGLNRIAFIAEPLPAR